MSFPRAEISVGPMQRDGRQDVSVSVGDLPVFQSEILLSDSTERAEFVSSVTDLSSVSSSEVEDKLREHSIEHLLDVYGIQPPLDSVEFDAADFAVDYLINDVLPTMQLTGIAGPEKSMKTTTSVDLAISLATKSPFLGRFIVPEPKRVLLLSAESGQATLQETARRIANSKGIQLADAKDDLCWAFWVPRAKNCEQMEILRSFLVKHKPDVAIIDPLYQTLDGDDQASVSNNGQQITDLARACLDLDCTPILVDHAKRSSDNVKRHKPLELSDITGAGKAEVFRSWILLGRRERFDPETPLHRMWLTIGGSAGHSGGYAIDIDETRNAIGERGYKLTAMAASEAKRNISNEKNEKQDAARIQAASEKIWKALESDPDPLSKTKLKNLTSLKEAALMRAIDQLSKEGKLKTVLHKCGSGPEHTAYVWVAKDPQRPELEPSAEPGTEPMQNRV